MKSHVMVASCLVIAVLLSYCTPPEKVEEIKSPTFLFVEGHAPVWEAAISQVIALIDSMPGDQLGYRPHEELRTFSEQIVHIGGSSKVIANLYLKDIPPPAEQPEMDIESMSKEDLKAFVKGQLSEAWEIIASVSDEDLKGQIKSFGGNDMTRMEGLLTVHDHLSNHKAKVNMYVRLSGNNPPPYSYY
ncbi:MAG: DinB family protein [Cyclobacteriaceae bacterium]